MIDVSLYNYMETLLKLTPMSFKRYMYDIIPWDNRLTGIVGPRGVGKSTLLLQHLALHRNEEESLYVMADNVYFSVHSILDLATAFVKEGGVHLYVDEIHKYKGWSQELKQIYDLYPQLKVTFTGSSVLDIREGEADLSRRVLIYEMQGMSFREYLRLAHDIPAQQFSLEQIVANQATIEGVEHPLPLFRKYLTSGYYPFGADFGFEIRINQIISQTVESDIPQYADMKASTARKLKQLLAVVSHLAPFKPNADNLAREIGISKNNVSDYLIYLEKAGMIGQLRDDTGGLRGLGKVEKVYLDNPNLMTVLANGQPDLGNLRETFFYNQMRVNNGVIASRDSDFCINEFTFEVGGYKKGKKQIEDIKHGIVVRDDIEIGHGSFVPLWAFGLNY